MTISSVSSEPEHLILLTLDNVPSYRFVDELKKHHLPFIEEFFINQGGYTFKCVTVFPSSTAPAHASLLTGKLPVEHEVVGMKIWDRASHRYFDFTKLSPYFAERTNSVLSKSVKNIFEHWKGKSVSSHFYFRGATQKILTPSRLLHLYSYKTVFSWNKLIRNYTIPRLYRRLSTLTNPHLEVIWLPETDEISHRYKPTSERYSQALRNLDANLELAVKGTSNFQGLKNLLSKLQIVLVADHGSHDVETPGNLEDYFRFQDVNLCINGKPSKETDIVLLTGASAVQLFAKNKNGAFKEHLTEDDLRNFQCTSGRKIDLIEELLKYPNTGNIYVRVNNGVKVISRKGSSFFQIFRDNTISYKIVEGHDPLEYENHFPVHRRVYSAEEFFHLTVGLKYPFIPFLIDSHFGTHSTAPDMLINSGEKSSLWSKFIGEHETDTFYDMVVPFMVHAPHIKVGEIEPCLITDVLGKICSR